MNARRGFVPILLLAVAAVASCGPHAGSGDPGASDASVDAGETAGGDGEAGDVAIVDASADEAGDASSDGALGDASSDVAMGDADADANRDAAPDAKGDAAPSDAPAGEGGADAPDGGSTPPPCGATPAAKNVVIPFFSRIFAGQFALVNHFDHDVPEEFSDTNGYQIDWCGRRRASEIDGHSGYDFSLPEGTPVLAAADGTVNWSGNDISFYCPLKGQQVTDQLRVEITHKLPDGRRVTSNYKHFSRIDVAVGQKVRAGDVIGLSGNTGCSTGPHLHFETWLMDGTRSGSSVLIDAFGWEGAGSDPWDAMLAGAPSIWLWKPGAAPDIFSAP